MVAGIDHGDSFKRDMGYSLQEFLRILPTAVGEYNHDVRGNLVMITDTDSNLELELEVTELPDRQIGMIRIPRVEIGFRFQNFSKQQRQQFMINFDRSFQRGGG